MENKYQIIFLGTLNDATQQIEELLFKEIEELKLPKEFYKIIRKSEVETQYKENQPTYALYFGNLEGMHEDVGIAKQLLEDGNAILPIFYNSFGTEIPSILENQNGLEYNSTKNIKAVNLILESFGKLRNTRKVFVSYKRDESTSVAIQLYEALERNNFDVFLDTHSIKQGEPFQDELWHRMADCDVIVLLNTPGFLDSRWCKEEIAEASAKQIGVVQLIWPYHKLNSSSEFCFPIQLQETDFEENVFHDKDRSKLKKGFVDELVMKVESIRARNLAARQDNLILEFTNLATKHGKKVNLQPERFITQDLGDNRRRIFIPLVGIPQSIDCNQTEELRKEINNYEIESIHLLFDDIRIRDKWLKHLEWLNNYLDVKTLKKQNFDKWLQLN